MSGNGKTSRALAAAIPSLDELLNDGRLAGSVSSYGRAPVADLLRTAAAEIRQRLRAETDPRGTANDRHAIATEIIDRVNELVASSADAGVRRVINATGVILHTNLGRAPLAPEAIQAMAAAGGAATIEYDLAAGSRGRRGPRAVDLLKQLTGAEDALIVNNCAAAAYLVLSVLAQGREVIVSRGELVEIGGDFRVPEILARSGAIMREVGTTNKTHLRDYESAITDRTAMILRVHTSNFRIRGFTGVPERRLLAALARSRDLLLFEDAGSGALDDLSTFGIDDEPVISQVLSEGADIVTFSGDKLVGGPQCGLIAGRKELVGRLASDPLFRALRVDKTITAGLEETLEMHASGRRNEIPTYRMLEASAEEIKTRSRGFQEDLVRCCPDVRVELFEGRSAVGGGSAPDTEIPTTLTGISHPAVGPLELEARLRASRPPVIARIRDEMVVLDLRTVSPADDPELVSSIRSAIDAALSRSEKKNPA